MNNQNRQIIEKTLKVRDEEIKSFISIHNDQIKDDEKYAEIAYFVETNIDVMKYKFKHLSMNDTNFELHAYIKEHIPHDFDFKKIDKILFKHRIYDGQTIIFYMSLFFMFVFNVTYYYKFSNYSDKFFINFTGTCLLSIFIAAILCFIIFEIFKFKLYRTPKLNDL